MDFQKGRGFGSRVMARRLKLFSGLSNTINVLDLSPLSNLTTLTANLNSPEKARSILGSRDTNGYTLLHHAALNGCVGAMNILLSNNGKRDCKYGLV